MNTRHLIERNQATRRLQLLAFWGGLGGIVSAWGLFGYNWLDYAPGVAGAIVAIGLLLAFSSSIPAVFAIETYLDAKDDENPPPPEPPANDASDMLTFDQSHQPGLMRIERREGDTIVRGRIGLKRRQWQALVDELVKHREGGVVPWSRRKIENHNMPRIEDTNGNCFISLQSYNADGETKYKVLTREMQRMGIVNRAGNRVLDSGWVELCRLAFGDEGIVI